MAKKQTTKQKEALKKGHALMARARQIQKASGTKTVPSKTVYKKNMKVALKEAAAEQKGRKVATKKKKVSTLNKRKKK